MPVDDAIPFGDLNFYQTSPTRAHLAGAGLRRVNRAVRGAHEPLAGTVKKTVGLEVHLHGHMGAAVQVSVNLALEAHCKCASGLAGVDHVKRHGVGAVLQIGGIAQGNGLRHGGSGLFRR